MPLLGLLPLNGSYHHQFSEFAVVTGVSKNSQLNTVGRGSSLQTNFDGKPLSAHYLSRIALLRANKWTFKLWKQDNLYWQVKGTSGLAALGNGENSQIVKWVVTAALFICLHYNLSGH